MAKAAVFLAGLFFGGAIDHAILAVAGRTDTPYGVRSGVAGNWALAALDVALSAICWRTHSVFERRSAHGRSQGLRNTTARNPAAPPE
jgi:hypothetical protein